MTLGGTLLIHGEKHAATLEDKPSLRRIRDELSRALDEHFAIAEGIADADARADFLKVFADDVRRCWTVIRACQKRLEGRP